jgi:hypothetical protein
MKNHPRKGLKPPKHSCELIDMYYLQARSHLLETAAILDRIERADGGREALQSNEKIQELFKICEMLPQSGETRTKEILHSLSI